MTVPVCHHSLKHKPLPSLITALDYILRFDFFKFRFNLSFPTKTSRLFIFPCSNQQMRFVLCVRACSLLHAALGYKVLGYSWTALSRKLKKTRMQVTGLVVKGFLRAAALLPFLLPSLPSSFLLNTHSYRATHCFET